MTPSYWNDASRDLASRDSVLKVLIRNHEGAQLQSRGDAFMTLARSIIGQQISVQAADDGNVACNRPFVPAQRHFVSTDLRMVLNPVVNGGPADEE